MTHDGDIESRLRAAMQEAIGPVTGTGIDQDEIYQAVARRRQLRRYGITALGGLAAAAALAAVVLIDAPGQKVKTIQPSGASDTTTTVEPTSTTTQELTSTTTDNTTTTAVPLPEFPGQVTPYYGTTTWGVYLLAGRLDPDSADVHAVAQRLADAGYIPEGSGIAFMQPLRCDEGAPEALGQDGLDDRVSVYFATEQEAEQARSAFEARGTRVLGVVEVDHRCQE